MDYQRDLIDMFSLMLNESARRIDRIDKDNMRNPTPCSEWDVRDLLSHIVSELLWMPLLLEGQRVAEAEDRFQGDVLGDNPKEAWRDAADEVVRVLNKPGVLERTAHLSYGDVSGRYYVQEVLTDQTIHTWDLSKGIETDDSLNENLVDFVYGILHNRAEAWRKGGVLGKAISVPRDADTQTKLLALAGRDRYVWR